LAGSLKRELEAKYGIQPKVSHAYGDLEVMVNGRSVFSHKREGRTPSVNELLVLVESAA